MPKRKATNGFNKAVKRFKSKHSKKGKPKRKIPAKFTIPRPRFFSTVAHRVRTKHVNKLSWQISAPATGFTNTTQIRLAPLRLRDPDTDVKNQSFPERFLSLCRLFQRYRVYGVKLIVSVHGLTNSEDEKFYLAVYGTSHDDGTTDPYESTKIADRQQRDAFLQHAGLKRKLISDSGTTGNRMNTVFRPGYFSIAKMEHKRWTDMEDEEYSGAVDISGGNVSNPNKVPNIWFRILSPRYTGFTTSRTYDLNVTAVFDVEWYDRRDALALGQGETDP